MSLHGQGQYWNECHTHTRYVLNEHLFPNKKRDRKNELKDRDCQHGLKGVFTMHPELTSQQSKISASQVGSPLYFEGGDDYQSDEDSPNHTAMLAPVTKQKQRSQNAPPQGFMFAKEQTQVLQKWFLDHVDHPYIKKVDKALLAQKTGLSTKQITGWFTNNRKRKYQKVVEAAKKRGKDTDYVRDIMKMKFDKDLDQNLSNSAGDDFADSEKLQIQSVGSRKHMNGADLWAPDQMFAKNENAAFAIMSNSTRQNQKEQSLQHLMEMRSKNDFTEHISNRNSLGGVYDLLNSKNDMDSKDKAKLMGKRPTGSRLIDNISFDGTLTIKQPKMENQNEPNTHLASQIVNQNQLFQHNQNVQNRQTTPYYTQINLNGGKGPFIQDQLKGQPQVGQINRQNSHSIGHNFQSQYSNIQVQPNGRQENESLDEQIIGQINLEGIDIKKLTDIFGPQKIQGHIRSQSCVMPNQTLNVQNLIKQNNEIGNDIVYGGPQPNNLQNNIGLIKTNGTNVSSRSYNIIQSKQNIELQQNQPKIQLNQRPQRILIDSQNSQPLGQQLNGPTDGQAQSNLTQIKLMPNDGYTQIRGLQNQSQAKPNGQWAQVVVPNQRIIPQIQTNQINMHQVPIQLYQNQINQGILQSNMQDNKIGNLRVTNQISEKLPVMQNNQSELEKKLVNTIAQILNCDKEGSKQIIENKQAELQQMVSKQMLENKHAELQREREKQAAIKESKLDKAVSQAVDLNQKNQIYMQAPNKNRLIQGQSIGSKNNNSSGFSGYLNSNSGSKSTVEKIQENLKEIKFIPIIFTVCPNKNNSEAQTMQTSNFPTAMTTQERIQEDANARLFLNNLQYIEPIINIESQILAVMQHYNKKQMKDTKNQQNYTQKYNADDIDDKFRQDANRDSGKNDSGQTKDNKGDTTNSKEKDSKDLQKSSDQFLDFFNNEELINNIDQYVRTQLKYILLKSTEKVKTDKQIQQIDRAQSQKIPINYALNNSPSKTQLQQYEHQPIMTLLNNQLNQSNIKYMNPKYDTQEQRNRSGDQQNGASLSFGDSNEMGNKLRKQGLQMLNQNLERRKLSGQNGEEQQFFINLDQVNNQHIFDQMHNGNPNQNKEELGQNMQQQQSSSFNLLDYYQILQKNIDPKTDGPLNKDLLKMLDNRVQKVNQDSNECNLEKFDLKNQKFTNGHQIANNLMQMQPNSVQKKNNETMADIDQMNMFIENEQKKILKTLQQLSDNPQLEQLLNQNSSQQYPATYQRINKEHMSQQMMPVNCNSFMMTSVNNSITKAIQQKCPDSFNNGNPSSNSHVIRDSSNSHDSNGSLVFNNSNSQVEAGSTKQANIQKLQTDNYVDRHAKSNGIRSPDDSGQSSVPNKGSKYSKDILLSEDRVVPHQVVPAIKEQQQEDKQKQEVLQPVQQQQIVEGAPIPDLNTTTNLDQPNVEMVAQSNSINQNQRVDIIELLQNVIFELQNQIDTNQVQSCVNQDDSMLQSNQPQTQQANQLNINQVPLDQGISNNKLVTDNNIEPNNNIQNQNQLNANMNKMQSFTKLPTNILMEMLQNKVGAQNPQVSNQFKQIGLSAIQQLNIQNLVPAQKDMPTIQVAQPIGGNLNHLKAPLQQIKPLQTIANNNILNNTIQASQIQQQEQPNQQKFAVQQQVVKNTQDDQKQVVNNTVNNTELLNCVENNETKHYTNNLNNIQIQLDQNEQMQDQQNVEKIQETNAKTQQTQEEQKQS